MLTGQVIHAAYRVAVGGEALVILDWVHLKPRTQALYEQMAVYLNGLESVEEPDHSIPEGDPWEEEKERAPSYDYPEVEF